MIHLQGKVGNNKTREELRNEILIIANATDIAATKNSMELFPRGTQAMPEVAAFMGAFEEKAISLSDIRN
jgi:hypothetical protein